MKVKYVCATLTDANMLTPTHSRVREPIRRQEQVTLWVKVSDTDRRHVIIWSLGFDDYKNILNFSWCSACFQSSSRHWASSQTWRKWCTDTWTDPSVTRAVIIKLFCTLTTSFNVEVQSESVSLKERRRCWISDGSKKRFWYRSISQNCHLHRTSRSESVSRCVIQLSMRRKAAASSICLKHTIKSEGLRNQTCFGFSVL